MSDEARFGILLTLDDSDLESGLKTTAAIIKAMAKQMKEDTTIKMDFTGEEVASMIMAVKMRLAEINEELKDTKDQDAIGRLTKEASDLNDILEFLANNAGRLINNGEEGSKKIEINLKGSVKQAMRLALGLVGIRGIWSALTRASHSYMEDNKMINQQLKLTFNLIGQLIGAAVKSLVNIVEYAVIVIAKLIQIMTGYNAITKANAAALKNLGKQAKKTHNALASFDTISNLADNSDAMEEYAAALSAYNDFLEKQKEVDSIFDEWGKDIDNFLKILASLWGAKTLLGLGALIGKAGTLTTAGAGLLGVSSILSGLAAMAALTITIWLVIEGYETLKYVADKVEQINNTSSQWQDLMNKRIDNMVQKYSVLSQKNKKTNEEEKEYLMVKSTLIGMVDDYNDKLKSQAELVDLVYQSGANFTKQGKETIQELKDLIVNSYSYSKSLMNMAEQGNWSAEEQEELKNAINNQITAIDTARKSLPFWTQEYKDATKQIDDLKDSLDKVDGTYDAKVNIKANTKDAEKGMSNFINKILNSGLGSIPVFSSIKNLFKFDVGTNYVPQDMTAVVHKGEMIVPKKYNPATSGIGGSNDLTNELLKQLNETLENKQMVGVISASDIVNTAINGINEQSRIMGRSVVR